MSRAFSKARRALTQRSLKRRAGVRLREIIVACKLKGEIARPGMHMCETRENIPEKACI